MANTSSRFLRLWRDESIRSNILSHLDTESVCFIRLMSTEICDFTTSDLFARTRLTFTPSALTRPSRLEALSRIGHHIQHLTFSMPHTPSTFLPPLLNPSTGREVNFLYTPLTTSGAVTSTQRPKYGCSELGDLLTQQYPPIFHAATNVPAFINALSQTPNLRHLTISCPGQDPSQRYRRDAVDYALISLRIAIERARLPRLEKLSLSHLHPAGLVYLRHMPGFGCSPSAGRRWKQIRRLNITVDSWDFLGLRPGLDHLKILDDYIRSFSASLDKVSFGWSGRKGPCPFTLFSDPLFAPPRETSKLFGEVTSLMSPLPGRPPRPAMSFPRLRNFQVRNATMSSEQVADFILEHRHTVKEFDFENVVLVNGGTWEDALKPLMRTSSSEGEEWRSQASSSEVDMSSNGYRSDEYLDLCLEEQLRARDEVVDSTAMDWPLRTSVCVKKQRVKRRRRKRKHNHPREPTTSVSSSHQKSSSKCSTKLAISAPIPIQGPIEEALMPQEVLMPTTFSPYVQGNQRNVRMEAQQQELADDPEIRISTLKKAKEAVLKQLGKEFQRGSRKKDHMQDHMRGLFKNSCSMQNQRKHGVSGMTSSSALVPLMFSRY